MGANKGAEIKADELLDFIARERSVDSKEKLHESTVLQSKDNVFVLFLLKFELLSFGIASAIAISILDDVLVMHNLVNVFLVRLHISFIRQARPMEVATIKKYMPSSDKKSKKRPLFTSQKKQLDDNFSVISKRIKSFSTEHGNKHIRFKSSSEDEDNDEDNDDDIETDDNEDEACLTSQSKNSSQVAE
nr:histidine kinase-, DNA gyrase B-, and HSP90-like ATPase family protein [Tanacetum cinerariifolium]